MYNDGVVKIYTVTNSAANGKMPVNSLTYKQALRYEERTVGVTRFYAALQANVRVEYVLRCPKLRSVSTQNVAVPNDGQQYKIAQVQYPKDAPNSMDLTLEGVTAKYELV